MPSYPSAEALISDADLRLDRFGKSVAVLVVEGPDDKRLFSVYTIHRQQVIGAGGRRLLLSALALADRNGRDDILFIADCDYEVRSGGSGQPQTSLSRNRPTSRATWSPLAASIA